MKRPSLIAAVLSFFLVLAGMDATAGGFSGNALEEQDDTLRTSLEGMSAIYRAKLAKQYPMRYNGTPYWDTCGFKKGTVIFNGRLYEDMLVNLDAAQGEVSVKFSDQLAPSPRTAARCLSSPVTGRLSSTCGISASPDPRKDSTRSSMTARPRS